MEWFNLSDGDDESGGVLELPESKTGPHVALELHVVVTVGGRTVAYWMLDDGVFVSAVEPGRA